MIVFIFIAIAVGITGGLLYLIYIPFKSRLLKSGKLSSERSALISRLYIIVLLIVSIIQTYLAFNPTDSFYFDEFQTVTLRRHPKSAEIREKISSYPDVHGKYCSSSLIKLSKEDYITLYNELSTDSRFKMNGEIFNTEEFDRCLDGYTGNLKTYFIQLIKPSLWGDYSYIGFMDDNQTIVINKYNR